MNLFIVHSDPTKAARMLCDRHVVKMPLETAQMLVTSLVTHGLQYTDRPKTIGGKRYKCTHDNHPCTVWTGLTSSNFRWSYQHGMALCNEYNHRYGRIHACQSVIQHCWRHRSVISRGSLTPFVKAMPDEYKRGKAVTAYRRYYMLDKWDIATWNHSRPPQWWPFAA